MKFIRTIFQIAALAAVAFVATPRAEAQTIHALLTGGTNFVSAGNSNKYSNLVIPVTYSKNVAIYFSFSLQSGSWASNGWFFLDASADNTNWKTNVHTLGVAAAGTGIVSAQTNIDVGAMPFLRLGSIYNTNAISMTNVTFTAVTKRGL